ncbi:MAG: recombinase RecT [Cellvibrio sp.]
MSNENINAPVLQEASHVTASTLIMQGGSFDRVMTLADTMARGKTSIPEHLRGNAADCAAIVMQALQWGMNPFAVAQKTHIVSGKLGYEAQLVNAVLQSTGAIHGRFHYEYSGEGENLSCRVGAIPAGESALQWGEWLTLGQVTIRNSPLWKTNPKQQIGYLQVKNWGRAFCPGAILGVYTPDELETIPQEREINPAPSEKLAEPEEKTLPEYSQDAFKKNLPAWEKLIASGKKTADAVIATISSKSKLSDEQIDAIKSIAGPIEGEAEVVPNENA